ncbi:MAG: hypothetical protein Q9M32_05745 [Sulfurimonas sp.]|nr:hypothetical protein [Sulfurimonas sp.]MDQ7060063.1 hypothetical protein [Sulfurimonas sp.]
MNENVVKQRSNEEEKQRKMRYIHIDAQKYALESVLEEELLKDPKNLEHFFLHVAYEKLKKDSKLDKLIYFYIGIVVGIISSLFMAIFFS